MFEFQKCMLAVLNMPQMKETIVASMQKFEVVGIITNSIEEFRKLYSDIEIPIYDYSDFYILKNKIIVIDVHWTIDTRRSFDEIMKKYKFCLADDYIYYSMLQSKINTNDIFELSDRNPFQFKKIIQKIIGKRKIVVVHGNCQTHAISNMLAGNKEFSDNYITIVMPRIWEEDQCIVMEQLLKSDILKMADYLFTQEISQDNRHSPKYASNYLKTLVPESCENIFISNLFFLGYFPQYWKMKYPVGINLFHGKIMDATEYTDINVLRLILDNKSDEEILKTISSSEFYSQQELISGIENELKKFKKREHEQKIEIMMHDYLQDNYKKFLLFATSNHPTRDVLKELTQRILRRLKVNDLEISCPDDEIQSPMPTDWKYIIYPCVLKHLGIKRIMEYRFQAFFTSNELNCILGGDIFQYQAFPTENADQYFIEVKGDFETYMKIYIRCLRAAIMLL